MTEYYNKMISIVIVNYNTSEIIKKCLESIKEKTINVLFEIIVVDNNSTNREIEILRDFFPDVNFILLNENNGFGFGCNRGAEIAKGNYIAFINPDTIFIEDVFTPLIDLMEGNLKLGVCTGILQGSDNKLVYTFSKFPGYKWEFTEALGRGSHWAIKRSLKKTDIINRKNKPIYVDWVIGAFMFFRSDVFGKTKGFDESFFLYYEDVDIQKRVHELGYEIAVLPSVRICHLQRASVKSFEGENLYYFHMMKSKFIYFYKHEGLLFIITTKIMHLIGILLRIFALPFRLEFKGKKRQKYYQYKLMMRIILSGYRKLLKFKFSDIKVFKYHNSNELIKDKFWN